VVIDAERMAESIAGAVSRSKPSDLNLNQSILKEFSFALLLRFDSLEADINQKINKEKLLQSS
jgi:hypothetical protein